MRNRKQFALSAFGVVVGIASFILFLSASMGVRNWLLGDMFPLEQVEVIPPRASLAGKKIITDETVKTIQSRSEVVSAVPRMALSFPAKGRAYFQGQGVNFEAGGFGDGVDPSFMAEEKFGKIFQDWESEENKAKQKPCGPAPKFACENPDRYYCQKEDQMCHHRVPVVVSTHVLELYNKQFAPSHNLPAIGKDVAQWIVDRGGYGKMKAYLYLGDSTVSGSKAKAPVRKVEAMLLGLSPNAMKLGFTVPMPYIKRWNLEYAGEDAATSYSSVVVTVKDSDDVATFGNWLQKDLDLRLEDSMGEQLATVILIITLMLLAISGIIVLISAINIAHNFFMQVTERRREIGLLRAVGATKGDIAGIILGEAALLGIVSGLIGWGVAWSGALLGDWASNNHVADFAFKPATWFEFHPLIVIAGLSFSVLFCVLGGLFPALRAARMQPAQALAQN